MPEVLRENRVAIIGGEGNMGKLTAELFQNLGYEALSVDPRNPESPTVQEAISQSRVVFFSVLPIENITAIIEENQNLLIGHLVLDNASVKRPFASAYESLDAKGISVCSTHPMCKHDQPLHGQKALILEVGEHAEDARKLAEALYESAGMITVPLSFEQHDSSMTVVQLIPHLVMRSVGRVLEANGVDVRTLREIAPANFQLFNLSMWRTLIQDPLISASVITNLLKQPEGEKLAGDLVSIIASVLEQKDRDALRDRLADSYEKINRNGFGATMNDVTTTVIERLANLDMKSIIIEADSDKVGLLRDVLLPFEENEISLTAIDSHKVKGKVRFEIGLDEMTSSSDQIVRVIEDLSSKGHTVISSK